MTFEQFMHAMNSHHAMNGNHSKSVKKRGSIAKGDYQTGLFGGGQGSSSSSGAPGAAQAAAQAAAQRAAQQAAQKAAEQAQRRADAEANQRVAQARTTQPATQPAANGAAAAAQNGNTRDAGDIERDRRRADEYARAQAAAKARAAATNPNGSAQAAQAQATAPVYQQSSGNGAAQAAQLGATTDPAARLRVAAQRGLMQRNAQQPVVIPANLASAFSSWLSSTGNAIGNAFAVPRASAAESSRTPTSTPTSTPTPTSTQQNERALPPTQAPSIGTITSIPTVAAGFTNTPASTETANPSATLTSSSTPTTEATRTQVYTATAGVPTASKAPPTLTNTPSPTATWSLGAKDAAQKKLADLALGLGGSKNFSGDIDTIISSMKGTVPPNPTAVTGPGGKGEYTLPFRDPSGYKSDEIPPYIPLLNNADSVKIADAMKTYENQRNPGSGTITGNPGLPNVNPGLPNVFNGWKEAAADAYPNSPSSLAEVGRPEWATPGMQLDEKTITGIYTAAHNAAGDARDAQTNGKLAYNTSIADLAKKMEDYNNGTATQQDVVNAARFAQTAHDNKILYDGRAAALANVETLAANAYARIINKTDDLHLKREGYDKRYPKEATPSVPTEIPQITPGTNGGGTGGGTGGRGNGNTTVTQPTITQIPTVTPKYVPPDAYSNYVASGMLTPLAEGVNTDIGPQRFFTNYDYGHSVPDYIKNRVYGNIVPASYRSPTPSASPTATATAMPTSASQATASPTQANPSGMGSPSPTRTATPTTQRTASPTATRNVPQPTSTQTAVPSSGGGNAAPAFGRGLGVGGGAGAMMGQSELVRAIQQLMGNQQTTQQQAISAYPQFATTQKRQKGKIKKDIGVGTGLTAHATQPVAESPMPRVHTSYGNYKFKKPSQENRSAKYGESQQLQQPVRKQIDAMQPRQTMVNPMQYPPSRVPQHTLNPMPLDSNESMMFKKYMGSLTEQPVQSNDKYLPAYLQRNKKDKDA